jgi:hypothetical protein
LIQVLILIPIQILRFNIGKKRIVAWEAQFAFPKPVFRGPADGRSNHRFFVFLEEQANSGLRTSFFLRCLMGKLQRYVLVLFLIGNGFWGAECSAQSLYEVDFRDPASVLGAVFHAAREGDFNILRGLCDPLGQGDGDTQRLCEVGQHAERLAQGSEDKASAEAVLQFTEAFRDARVTGKPVITPAGEGGRMAQVDFVFGPGGARKEQMSLVERYGNWYLAGF